MSGFIGLPSTLERLEQRQLFSHAVAPIELSEQDLVITIGMCAGIYCYLSEIQVVPSTQHLKFEHLSDVQYSDLKDVSHPIFTLNYNPLIQPSKVELFVLTISSEIYSLTPLSLFHPFQNNNDQPNILENNATFSYPCDFFPKLPPDFSTYLNCISSEMEATFSKLPERKFIFGEETPFTHENEHSIVKAYSIVLRFLTFALAHHLLLKIGGFYRTTDGNKHRILIGGAFLSTTMATPWTTYPASLIIEALTKPIDKENFNSSKDSNFCINTNALPDNNN